MPKLSYPYFPYPENPLPRPAAPAMVINLLNGKSAPLLGILDTGADRVSLTDEFLDILEIDPVFLSETDLGGVHGIAPVRYCDFLKIAFVELPSKILYFPNRDAPVPIHFTSGSPFCLLGQESFLGLCHSTFDGLRKVSTISF